MQYSRDGLTFTVTAASHAEAEWLARVLSPPAPEPTQDLGDLTARNAARAALYAEWEAARDAYDAQDQIALATGDRAEYAKLEELKQQVAAAYRRLQETETP